MSFCVGWRFGEGIGVGGGREEWRGGVLFSFFNACLTLPPPAGKGGFGSVYKVRRKGTGKLFAMKIQPKEYLIRSTKDLITNRWDKQALYAEHSVMASFREHAGFVKVRGGCGRRGGGRGRGRRRGGSWE